MEDGEPYFPGAYERLKTCVRWARGAGLNVMLDLHGAPGSQNGFDNSGRRDERAWFHSQSNADRTIAAVRELVTEFTRDEYGGAVSAVELLNEPFPHEDWERSFTRDFSARAYAAVRELSKDLLVVVHDGFRPLSEWADFVPHDDGGAAPDRIALDTHVYAMFSPEILAYGYVDNLRWTCGLQDTLRGAPFWAIVGEWTLANTDCAPQLNGRGRGARWDNSLEGAPGMKFPGNCAERTGGDPERWSQSYKDQLRASWQAQTWVYEQGKGWVFWTWRTEDAADWSMLTGLAHGYVPTPITALPDGPPCNFSSFIHNERYARSDDHAAAATLRVPLAHLLAAALAAFAVLDL